jgi:peptidoglycan/LPS O-acetylase OafA/YrhL
VSVVSQAVHKTAGTEAKAAGRFYLPELDVLRFFAFFGVFVFHLPEPFVLKFFENSGMLGAAGRAGAFGVDLFFTLSGYLITRLLLREREETGDIKMKAFYARRTLRIWPLYYFSLALAFILTQFPASIGSAPQLIGNLFAPMKPSAYFFFAIFLFNFNFYGSLLTYPLPLMGLLWSISVEEQFYLFWPWCVRYIPRKRIVIAPIVMIAIACIARASLTFDLQRLLWNYTFARLDPIAVGILIALIPALNPGRMVRLMLALVGVASWWFASSWCGLPYHDSSRLLTSLGFPAIALGSGAFVLAALGAKSLRKDTAPMRLMVYLGKISYGLYVYNSIAYSAAALFVFKVFLPGHGRSGKTLSLYALLAFALNMALAAASYRRLEAPFLRLKERFTRVPSRAV